MSNNLITAGLRIAASATGLSVFGGIKNSLSGIISTTKDLRLKQKELGDLIERNMGTLAPKTLAALNADYEKLGRTIDSLTTKHQRLNDRLAHRDMLRGQRSELRGQMFETGATAAAVGAPIIASIGRSMNFETELRDMSITGEFSKAEEARLGNAIRESSLRWNAFTDQVTEGLQKLTAGGIQEARALEGYAPIIAKSVTATKTSGGDLGNVLLASRRNLAIAEQDSESALNMLWYTTKRGAFEFNSMAKWFPNLAPMLGDLGFKGKEAVAELGAALQVAEIGAGSTDEAANNLRNFLSKITSQDTLKDFKGAGIDLQSSLMELRAKGLSPVQGMLQLITDYMGSKGPEALAQFKAAMNLQDDGARDAALSQLSSAYGLGELFQDQQTMAFIRPAIANLELFKSIRQGALDAGNQDLMGADWAKRMDTASSRMDAFKIGIGELGLSLGNALLPAVNDLLKTAIPLVHSFAGWAQANPGLISGVVKFAAGAVALRMGMLGAAYAVNLGASGLNGLGIVMSLVSGKFGVLQGAMALGKLGPLVTGLGHLRGGLVRLAPVLGIARTAFMGLGTAFMTTPIGWIIGGIALVAGAAYLIYRNWEPIKGFFGGLWTEIKTGFSGGLSGIATTILNFTPLGLFYRAFAGVMNYFGVEMPAKFSDFGGMLVTGLVNGIQGMATSLKDSVVGMGDSIKSAFTGEVQIKSPSRVFMGYGAYISEGAAIGITSKAGLVKKAALGMAAATAVTMGTPQLAAADLAASTQPAAMAAQGNAGGGGAVTVYLTQNFNLGGGAGGSLEAQAKHAAQISFQEFERLMQRYESEQRRRAF
ncbi:phage tail tape measure protein [Pseudomonas aeruginosa]